MGMVTEGFRTQEWKASRILVQCQRPLRPDQRFRRSASGMYQQKPPTHVRRMVTFVPEVVLGFPLVPPGAFPSSVTLPALWRLRNRFLHWTAGLPLMFPEMMFHRLPCFSKASKSFKSSAPAHASRPIEHTFSNVDGDEDEG